MSKFIETMKALPSTLRELGVTAQNNIGFILISIVVVAVMITAAKLAENAANKRNGYQYQSEHYKINRMALIAILSAIAIVLMWFRFPVFFAPSIYKLDFSELPVIIGAFTLGPVAGIVIELIKIVLNLLTNGTDSAFIGEFANFLMGCAFIIPASAVYYFKKSRKNAYIGLAAGILLSTVTAAVLNAYVIFPAYIRLNSYINDMSDIVSLGTKKNDAIDNLSTFIFYAVIPFNLLKFSLVSLLVAFIYKPISHLLKKQP